MRQSVQEQLALFLSDMYSVEQQALAQLVSAPNFAKDPGLEENFRTHYRETEEHARLIHERLDAYGKSTSTVKGALMKLGGKGFLFFARVQPETPGRLVDHAYSYEAMEWAGYEMLVCFAQQVDDSKTVETARKIQAQEHAMMEALKGRFEAIEDLSHTDIPKKKLLHHLQSHLAEVHAFESQSVQLLKKSQGIGGNQTLKEIYKHHLDQTEKHALLVEQQLEALDTSPSIVKDSALALGGLSWGFFFQCQSDTPAKLAAFVFAVLHLEIGGYELLKHTAHRCGDQVLTLLCDKIIGEKLAMATSLSHAFPSAVQATLDLLHRQ